MNEDELKEENAELHADYEALADENTKLRDQNSRLKAEVERLRKAGDAMLPFFVYPPYEKGSHKAVLNWNAAKEGKQP